MEHAFVVGLIALRVEGGKPSLAQLCELAERVHFLSEEDKHALRATLKDLGVKGAKPLFLNEKNLVTRFIAEELGEVEGVQRALHENERAIVREGDPSGALARERFQLQNLRLLYGTAPMRSEVREAPSAAEEVLVQAVAKRIAGEQLSLEEGLAAARALRSDFVTPLTRRKLHEQLLSADGRKLNPLRPAKQEVTLALLYSRDRVLDELAAATEGTPQSQRLQAAKELLQCHDSGHYRPAQDFKGRVDFGPSATALVVGGRAGLGVDVTHRSLESGRREWRPYMEQAMNAGPRSWGKVRGPEEIRGPITGVCGGGLSYTQSRQIGRAGMVSLIPGIVAVGATDRGGIEMAVGLPSPSVPVWIPGTSLHFNLGFPVVTARLRVGVEEPRAARLGHVMDWVRHQASKKIHAPEPKVSAPAHFGVVTAVDPRTVAAWFPRPIS